MTPHGCDQQWTTERSRALVVSGGDVEVDDAGKPVWLPTQDVPAGERYLLGTDDLGAARFAVHVDAPRSSASYQGLRQLVPLADTEGADWLCHAVALAQWHSTHTHCPRCGTPTLVSAAGAERRCPDDGSVHFPRVDPAVIVLVTDERDRALLGAPRGVASPGASRLGGFVEPGETAEQAVVARDR